MAATESAPVLSGVLLAIFAGSSAVGGLLYGLLPVQRAAERQVLALTLTLLAVTAGTGLIGGTAAAVVGFAVSGLFLAPVFIVGYLAANRRTPAAVRTEANSWVDTAVQLGTAVGAAVFGVLTDLTGPGPALALGAGVACLAVVVAGPSLLRAPRPST